MNKRGRSQLLPFTRQLHIRQTFHRLEKIVDARPGNEIEAEVRPAAVDLQEGGRLGVVTVLAFKEIPPDERISLLAQHDGGGEIGADAHLMGEAETIAVLVDGRAVGGRGRY